MDYSITEGQARALAAAHPLRWQEARELGGPASTTLSSLVARGFLSARWGSSSLRRGERRRYRLTAFGGIALKRWRQGRR